MFFFGSKKKKSQTHLVVSVESSHIRACFVLVTPHQKPFIIAEHIHKFSQGVSIPETKILMKKSLHTCLQELLAKHPTKITMTHCVLGAPWYHSRTYTYVRDEETPFLFRERDSKKLLKDAVSNYKQELVSQNVLNEKDLQLIEKNILHIALNGYEVSSLSWHHTRRVELTSYVSYADAELVHEIKQEIERHVKADWQIHTSNLVQCVVARDAFEYLSNFVLVSLDGAHTEISLIQDGALVFGTNFSLGDSLVEKHALRLGYSVPSILSGLAMLATNVLDGASRAPLERVLHAAQEEWRSSFFDVVSNMSQHNALPNQVVVLSKPKTFYWIQKALEDPRNKHLSVSDQHLHAILMNAESMQSLVGSKILNPDIKLMMYASFTTINNIS